MRIGIFANTRKPKVREIIGPFIDWLSQQGQIPVVSSRLQEILKLDKSSLQIVDLDSLPEESDAIVSMGGDGTLLAAARVVGRSSTPIIGVNLGGLGFLTEASVEEFYPTVERIIADDYSIEERMVLTTRVLDDKETREYFAINDVVIDRGGSPRTIRVDMTIDGAFFNTYISDGVIVSTPTGSTAYSLSAWGPIVLPALDSMILNPICPHALTVRPTVIPANCKIVLKVEFEDYAEALLSVDGQENILLPSGTTLEVERADYNVRLITLRDHSFFDRLREKLQWGGLPRK